MKFLKAFMVTSAVVSMSLSFAFALENQLVGYWPFDEGKGSPKDASGNDNHGKIEGEPKWVDGKFGKALEFDGKDDHIVVKDHPTLDLTKNLTIMAWFMPKAVITQRRMMSKNNSIFVMFDFGDPNTIDLLVKPNNDFVESKTSDWKVDQWYHFAGTYDGKSLRIYVNGKLEGEKKYGGGIAPSDLDLWIGGDDYGRPTDHFPGIIDEVRIYKHALNGDQIQQVKEEPAMLEASGKLTRTWGMIKSLK